MKINKNFSNNILEETILIKSGSFFEYSLCKQMHDRYMIEHGNVNGIV